MSEPVIFYTGKIKKKCFWIQCPDGRFFQVDEETKKVLEELANKKSLASIAEEMEVCEEEIIILIEKLGLTHYPDFILRQESLKENGPVIRKGVFWLLSMGLVFSLFFIFSFINNTPVTLVTSLKDLWIVTGLLTLSVIIHELGHYVAMQPLKNVSLSVHWSGPVPLLSIIQNEVWKLGKWKRVWINMAGFVADLFVLGFASFIGFFFQQLSPWIWSFFIVHLIRMLISIFPFMPGDGYWILVDLLDKPNLWPQSLTQLKQGKMNWLSVYALLRILLIFIFWSMYVYFLFLWLNVFIAIPIVESVALLFHPAPLLLLLNVLYQMYTGTLWVISKVRKKVKNPGLLT